MEFPKLMQVYIDSTIVATFRFHRVQIICIFQFTECFSFPLICYEFIKNEIKWQFRFWFRKMFFGCGGVMRLFFLRQISFITIYNICAESLRKTKKISNCAEHPPKQEKRLRCIVYIHWKISFTCGLFQTYFKFLGVIECYFLFGF